MHIKRAYAIEDVLAARDIVRTHPFATIVTADLQVTRMPCLLDEPEGQLVVSSHVALADPVSRSLDGPLLMLFHGPSGYVSASWYESETIPTWNHVSLHLRGTPERLDDTIALLRRTVDHFEARVERPWSLDRLGRRAEDMSREVVAFRLRAEAWHAEAKLSQDKPEEERARIIAELERPGPYADATLARAMRRASG